MGAEERRVTAEGGVGCETWVGKAELDRWAGRWDGEVDGRAMERRKREVWESRTVVDG